MKRILAFISILMISIPNLQAQVDDLSTIDGIINAMYDVISGDAGKERSADRLMNLYHPDARLIATVGKEEKTAYYMTQSQYIFSNLKRMEESGFFEREVHRITEQYGNMAHVWSTYEIESPEKKLRGINSVQLLNDGKRWYIINVFWQAEEEQSKVPTKYLE